MSVNGYKYRYSQWLLIVGFIGLTLLPLVMMKGSEKSDGESQLLSSTQQQQFNLKKMIQYPRDFAGWFGNHFGFRSQLISMYSFINLKLNINGNEKVIHGTNGWLYLYTEKLFAMIRNQIIFPREDLDQWIKYLDIKHRALGSQNIQYVFVLAPNKHTVHDEYLPDRFKPHSAMTSARRFLSELRKKSEANIIYLQNDLKRAATIYPVYQKTDTHWNQFGAAVAQESIINALNSKGLNVPARHYLPSEFEMSRKNAGDLARMLGLKPMFSSFEPKHITDLNQGIGRLHYQENTLFARRERIFRSPVAASPKRCLLIGDSFVNNLAPELWCIFEHLMVVRLHDHQLRHLDPFVKYINEFHPDVIIELQVTRNLPDLTPEDPPDVNFKSYPAWLKQQFAVKHHGVLMPVLEKRESQRQVLQSL